MSPFTSASPMLPTPMKPSFFLVTMAAESTSRRGSHPGGRRHRDRFAIFPGKRPIDGDRPAALDQQGDGEAQREDVVLEALAFLCSRPVHEEPDLGVHH